MTHLKTDGKDLRVINKKYALGIDSSNAMWCVNELIKKAIKAWC